MYKVVESEVYIAIAFVAGYSHWIAIVVFWIVWQLHTPHDVARRRIAGKRLPITLSPHERKFVLAHEGEA